MERHLPADIATTVALMARRAAPGRDDIRFDAVEKILLDAEADFAAEHVTPCDVVGDWLLSLAAGGRTQASFLRLRGRSRVTGRGCSGSGVHPAMVRAQARAFALSTIPGNRRRNSIAADSSPS